jgi:hypothetical protein
MADDKAEPRETNWRQLLPWTVLFQGFRVALDPNKLVLAAAGILLMAFGWWLLAIIFNYQKPKFEDFKADLTKYAGDNEAEQKRNAWKKFAEERQKWDVMYGAAGPADPRDKDAPYDAGDLADNLEDYEGIERDLNSKDFVFVPPPNFTLPHQNRYPLVLTQSEVEQFIKAQPEAAQRGTKVWILKRNQDPDPQQHILRPAGRMRTWPWKENRGPNPFLLVTGQTGSTWEKGQFWDWLLREQLPVLIEPLVKLLSPVIYFFNPKAGTLVRFYTLLVMLWTLLVWSFFGGAISRIAVVQVARQEKIGLMEAVRFAARKYLSYLSAPLFPLVLVAVLLIFMVLFGYLHMIPLVGDIVLDGLLWGLMILIGLAMAVVLVGLVGWPMMAATISAEGTDAWEAVSRSYSYVYQAPWHYIFYSLVALAYGAVVVFFVVFMASLTVYLSKWGVNQTPGIDWRAEQNKDRMPTYLFVYAPTSFEWRTLLLHDDAHGLVNKTGTIDEANYQKYLDSMTWYNSVGAALVSVVWVGIIFMLMLGFTYSYFWSATSIIYLLMRRKVDDAEMDEVYLEEEDEAGYAGPLAAKTAAPAPPPEPASTATRPSLPIVEAPRPTAAPVPPPAPPPAPPREEIAGAIHTAPPPEPPPAPEPPPPPAPGPDGNLPPAGP